MKRPHRSSSYQIKPRIRLVTPAASVRPYYSCIFRDPCNLMQTRGTPLNWKHQYIGVGYSVDDAIRSCQMEYMRKKLTYQEPTTGYDPRMDYLPEEFYGPSQHTRWWQFWSWIK